MKNDLAAIDGAEEQYSLDREVGGFDVACVDLVNVKEAEEWKVATGKRRARRERAKSDLPAGRRKVRFVTECGCGTCSAPAEPDTAETKPGGSPPRTVPIRLTGGHYEEENVPIRLTDGHYGEIDICAVDTNDAEMIGKGKITIDSGAAESVLPQGMLNEIQLQQSEGSKKGVQYIAANGGKMPNLGEKKVHFRTKDGMESNVVFQVTHARKPLASVSKIVQKGNKVVFSPAGSYIENIQSGKRIELGEANGTYYMDVEFLAKDFHRRA